MLKSRSAVQNRVRKSLEMCATNVFLLTVAIFAIARCPSVLTAYAPMRRSDCQCLEQCIAGIEVVVNCDLGRLIVG